MESKLNSTRIPIKAGGSYMGIYESINENKERINILCKTDQKCTLTIEHSSDKKNSDYDDSYSIFPNSGASIDVPARGKFFRIKINNTSDSNQTYMRCHCFMTGNIKTIPSFDIHCSSILLFDNFFVNSVEFSVPVDVQNYKKITIMGSCSGQTSIIVQASPDGLIWFDSNMCFEIIKGDYYHTLEFLCKYIRLKVKSFEKYITSYVCIKQ